MNKILILVLTLSLLNNNKEEVNYLKYHQRFSKIEALIVNEKFIEAETKLERLLSEYEPIFAKDYVIAAQLALLNNHKSKSLEWIKESFEKGVKVHCLKSIPLLETKLSNKDWQKLESQFPDLYSIYNSKINTRLSKLFNKNYQIEQNNKRDKDYKRIVYSNFVKIKQRVIAGTFPGEELIGIDNSDFANKISECDLDNAKITVTLLHYDYAFSELTEKRLINAIRKGELHPREFAIIYAFEKNRVSVLYRSSNKSKKALPNYNFNFAFDKLINDIQKVDLDRSKFGICSFEIDKKKKSIEEKFGLKLKFGYR